MSQQRVNGREPAPGTTWRDWVDPRRVGWLPMLLIFVPVTVAADWMHASAITIFILAGVAIIPLAGLIGESTESLAHRMGPGIGGLLNATFGNAAELIIAAFALFKGLDGVVKASLTGSILGNLLLVMGASLLAGGIRFPLQKFNRTAAGSGASLMVLASVGMVIPAVFHQIVGENHAYAEHGLSLSVSVILMLAYGLNLLFSLVTHDNLFNPASESFDDKGHEAPDAKGAGSRGPAIKLLLSTAFVAWMSEILVGAVEEASHTLGLTEVFVGVVIVAVVGNAAEHSTAVLVAWKNKMDLSVGIAMGSALQIALFVAPVLVFASYLRDEPMDLLFTPLEVVAVILAAILARMVAEDGESNWLEGAMLLMIYAILAMTFFFLPENARPVVQNSAGTHGAIIAPAMWDVRKIEA